MLHTSIKLHIYIILVFLFMLTGASHLVGQSNYTQGVSIRQDTVPPHTSAVLEVSSSSKGVLLPRITIEENETLSTTIPNADNGLIVYVTNPDHRKGFWMYQVANSVGKWYHLRKSRTSYPIGTILMYYLQDGEVLDNLFPNNGIGTEKMEGWYLCNGENGTPDLRGKFICGIGGSGVKYSAYNDFLNPQEYGYSGDNTGNNKLPVNNQLLTENEIPKHEHIYEDGKNPQMKFKHGHIIPKENLEHKHSLPVVIEGQHKGMKFHGTQRAREGKWVKFRNNFFNEKYLCHEQEPETKSKSDIQAAPAGQASPESFSNRPVYYVMVFIIRSDGFDFNDTNNYKNDYSGFVDDCPEPEGDE